MRDCSGIDVTPTVKGIVAYSRVMAVTLVPDASDVLWDCYVSQICAEVYGRGGAME